MNSISAREANRRVKAGEFPKLPRHGWEVLSLDQRKVLSHERGKYWVRLNGVMLRKDGGAA